MHFYFSEETMHYHEEQLILFGVSWSFLLARLMFLRRDATKYLHIQVRYKVLTSEIAEKY